MPRVADYIEQHRDALVERFVEEASKLPSALGAKRNEIIDTFYEYLSTLAASSRQGERGEPARTRSRLEETHIGLRLRMGYSQEEVTSEYVLLGRLITQLWEGLPSAEHPTAEDVQLLFEELSSAMDTVVSTYTGYSVEDRQREKRTLRRLDALAARVLEEGGEPGPHLTPLLDVIQEAMGAEGADLLLLDEEGGRLVLVAAGGRFAGAAEAYSVEVDGTAFAAVAGRSEEPVVLPRVADATTAVREAVRRSGLQSLLGLRLWPQGRLTGVLYVGVVEAKPFSPRARRSFETLVEYLSGIIDRARLLERMRKERAQALEAAEALRRSEAEWRLFVQSIEDYATIYRVDAEGRVASWNAGAERFEGYRAEEVMGRPISLLFYPEEARARGEPEAHLRQAAEEGRLTVEGWRVRGKQPSPFWAEMVLIAHRDEAGVLRGFTKITRDLTERRQLKASEERLRRTLGATGAGTFELDVSTDAVRFDARMAALVGRATDSPLSLAGALAFIHPEDRAEVSRLVREALTPGGPSALVYEHRVVTPEGGERWLSVRAGVERGGDGQPVRLVGTAVDVTEQKRTQQQLELVFQRAPDMMGMASPEGRFVRVNPAFVRTLGWSAEQLATTPFLDLVHPGDVERTRAEFDKLLSGQSTLGFENRYRRVDGDYRWLAWAAAPLPGSSLVFSTARDVTEERSRVDFEQKLIGIVGHDLRQPLQVIAMSATLLLKRQTLEERSLSVVHRILGGAERASRMLRDILDFTQARLSGGIPLNLAEGDVVQVVQEAAEEVEAAHPGWRVELLVEGEGRGQWDADRLRQVLDNLLNNALTYGSPGVPVRLEVDGRAEDEVVLRVHNEGKPIAPELLPVLFDAMTRGDTQGGQRRSVGLGLFIVRHVVEAHGGRVSVQSEEGAGTTFTVRLPRRSSQGASLDLDK